MILSRALLLLTATFSGPQKSFAREEAGLNALSGLSEEDVAKKLANEPSLLVQLLQVGLSNKDVTKKLTNDPLVTRLLQEAGVEKEVPSKTSLKLQNKSKVGVCGMETGSASCPHSHSIEISTTSNSDQSQEPGSEYLGNGYNFLEGNPRGSFESDLDPGFRFPVLQSTAVPTFVKQSKTCTVSSEATDVSSTKDLVDNLLKESSQDGSVSFGFSGFGVSFDTSTSFSRSEKIDRRNQETETLNTVTLEASAMCIDYQIAINPYSDYESFLHPDFVNATGGLPKTFNISDPFHRRSYGKFLKTYGTHFITSMDMGGKFVVSNEMSSRDYQSLTSEEINVESSFSFEASFGFGRDETEDSGGGVDEFNDELTMEYVRQLKPACCDGPRTPSPEDLKELIDAAKKDPEPTVSPPAPWSISTSVKNSRTNEETRFKRNDEKAFSKVEKNTRYHLGGAAGGGAGFTDKWESWASTIPDNPMPVAYRYMPIWEMGIFTERRAAYIEAVKHLYGVDLEGSSKSAEPVFRYGVVESSGSAISTYSSTTGYRMRSVLELEYLPASAFSTDEIPVFIDETPSEEMTIKLSPLAVATDGFFACGLRAKWDFAANRADGVDDKGLTGLYVKFCSVDDWMLQEDTIVHREVGGEWQPWKLCSSNQYISQIKAWTRSGKDGASIDLLGIESLMIKCATVDGSSTPSYSSDGFDDIVPSGRRISTRTLQPAAPETPVPGKLIQSFQVQYGEHSNDKQGIMGLKVFLASAESIEGPRAPIYFYRAYFNLLNTQAIPIFATCIRGKLAPNLFESNQISVANTKGELGLESGVLYTVMDEVARPKIAVSDFKNDIKEWDLPLFSFLVADEPSEIFDGSGSIVAGVVHPDGFILRYGRAAHSVRVAYDDPANPQIATLAMGGSVSSQNERLTLLISPVWFPDAQAKYPTNTGDITAVSSGCTKVDSEWKCSVHVGSAGNLVARSHLGFSFMAVGDTFDKVSANHGQIKMLDYELDPSSSFSHGVQAEANFSDGKRITVLAGDDLATVQLSNQSTGGVKLKFDPPFEDTPAVLVSPVVRDGTRLVHTQLDLLNLPHAVVEHITPEEAFIRAGMVRTSNLGDSLSFNKCQAVSNVHQTFILEYNVIGPITIGGGCLGPDPDGTVAAKACSGDAEQNFKWIYDGARIRSHRDQSKCLWIVNGDPLRLHECGSLSDRIDDERLHFEMFHNSNTNSDETRLHTAYRRCLFKRSDGSIRTSGQGSSDCTSPDKSATHGVTTPTGFMTAGFKIRTAPARFQTPESFSTCLSCSSVREGRKVVSTAVRLSKSGRQAITLNRVWISCLGGDADIGQVSKGAAATQSSTNGTHIAEEALSTEGFSYTLLEDNPWWEITLGGDGCIVSHVEINDLGLVGLTVSLLNDGGDTIAERTITQDMASRPSPGDGSQRPFFGARLDFSPDTTSVHTGRVTPLGDCYQTSWILSQGESNLSSDSYRIQLVDSPNNYLYRDNENKLTVNSVGSMFSLRNDIHTDLDVSNLAEKLKTSRLQAEDEDLCVEWARDISSDGSYSVDSIWEPMDFNFLVVAPSIAQGSLKGAQSRMDYALAEETSSLYSDYVDHSKGSHVGASNLRGGAVA